MISWIISYVVYNIFYLIKYKKNIKKLIEYNLKYFVNNYIGLYIWNLNQLFNINRLNFIQSFINLNLLCIISFCMISFLIYITNNEVKNDIYNHPFITILYKKNNHRYLLFNLLTKSLIGIFIAFYYLWNIGNNYSLIIICLLKILYDKINSPYKNCFHNKINQILNFNSLLIIIISELEILLNSNVYIFYIKSFFYLVLLINIIIFIIKKPKLSNQPINLNYFYDIEMGIKVDQS